LSSGDVAATIMGGSIVLIVVLMIVDSVIEMLLDDRPNSRRNRQMREAQAKLLRAEADKAERGIYEITAWAHSEMARTLLDRRQQDDTRRS